MFQYISINLVSTTRVTNGTQDERGAMPTWVRPDDVVFDHAAAGAAVEAIAAARFVVDWTWAAEEDGAQRALARWEGRAADGFGRSHRARRNHAEAAIEALRSLELAINAAMDDAIVEQGRVDQQQAAWDAQRQAELLAEQDQAEGSSASSETSSAQQAF